MIHICRYLGDEGSTSVFGHHGKICHWEIAGSTKSRIYAELFRDELEAIGEKVKIVSMPAITPGRLSEHSDWWNFLYTGPRP